MEPEITSAFAAFPPSPRARLMEIRGLILAAAKATGTAPLTETLKWGQPAYLPARKEGTTIRLGLAGPQTCAFYVHCQTDLIGRAKLLFPTEFTYQNNRAVLIPATGTYARDALQQFAAMALTYHRDKAHS